MKSFNHNKENLKDNKINTDRSVDHVTTITLKQSKYSTPVSFELFYKDCFQVNLFDEHKTVFVDIKKIDLNVKIISSVSTTFGYKEFPTRYRSCQNNSTKISTTNFTKIHSCYNVELSFKTNQLKYDEISIMSIFYNINTYFHHNKLNTHN